MHGEPTWSFLYRKLIPVFVEAGFRAVAPDLIGFGRSDKPTRMRDYSYRRHVDWVVQFLDALDLGNITLVCQDWGSLLGLRIAAGHFIQEDRGEELARRTATGFAEPERSRVARLRCLKTRSRWET